MANPRHPNHSWAASLEADPESGLLDLLHREADGENLSAAELALLDERKDDPDVQAARTALRRAVMFLSGPNPPVSHLVPQQGVMPRSIAAQVAVDIALSARLDNSTSALLPRSVAAQVAAEVALSRQFQQNVPALPRSVAASVVSDLTTMGQLAQAALPPMPRSVAASVMSCIGAEAGPEAGFNQAGVSNNVPLVPQVVPQQVAAFAALTAQAPADLVPVTPRNPAPLLLIGSLLVGVTLLGLTTAWPNLAAGLTVFHALLAQVSPLAGLGLGLLLLTSALVAWKPLPPVRMAGAGAFVLAAALTLPALYSVAGNGLSVGQNVVVAGPVPGNVIAIGGNIDLKPTAQVGGEVVTLLGDVHREAGAQVGGQVSALLGHAPGDLQAIQTRPVSELSLVTAAAFRPVLGWLGSAAWPQIFVALAGSLLLLLFLAGVAPLLACRQRRAPMQTLALGVLLLAALLIPAWALALAGLLGPALLAVALSILLIALGLSVSMYDAGRALAYRLRLPVPDVVGAMLGLSAFAASQSYAPLAFALALVGGAWGAGTLFLTRQRL